VQLRRIKIALLQATSQTRRRDARSGVGVHDAVCVVNARMNCAVQHIASRVDGVGRAIQHLALQIDFDQIAGRDLGVVKTKRVDQKLLVCAAHAGGQARRDVVVDHLRPAQHGEDAVASGQL
jgi:hypothetical protein